ncbi:MAG: AbrB/MazE/SpoVT family DNA-binding domain-containing protein [Pseudomonadota bacterium]
MNKPIAKPVHAKSLKLVRVGNSTGVILSKELLAYLRVGLGDELSLTEVPGGFTLKRHDSGFEEQMEAAREVMARRRNALRELAK